jgi:hypothetical protein
MAESVSQRCMLLTAASGWMAVATAVPSLSSASGLVWHELSQLKGPFEGRIPVPLT